MHKPSSGISGLLLWKYWKYDSCKMIYIAINTASKISKS